MHLTTEFPIQKAECTDRIERRNRQIQLQLEISMPLSVIDQTSRLKFKKNMEDLNNT